MANFIPTPTLGASILCQGHSHNPTQTTPSHILSIRVGIYGHVLIDVDKERRLVFGDVRTPMDWAIPHSFSRSRSERISLPVASQVSFFFFRLFVFQIYSVPWEPRGSRDVHHVYPGPVKSHAKLETDQHSAFYSINRMCSWYLFRVLQTSRWPFEAGDPSDDAHSWHTTIQTTSQIRLLAVMGLIQQDDQVGPSEERKRVQNIGWLVFPEFVREISIGLRDKVVVF